LTAPDSYAFSYDIHVFFRAPPRGAGNFSLLGQREVTKRKATPRTRPEHIRVLRMRERPPGFAEGTSLCLRRTGAHPVRHPSDFSVDRSPCSRGPTSRASCAHVLAKHADGSCSEGGHGWPVPKQGFSGAPVLRCGPDEKARRVGAMDCAHLPPRQGWRVGKPGRPARTFRPWMDEKRSTGVAFLWATFLWPCKERWLARPGGGRKKTGKSMFESMEHQNGFRPAPE
jgi:hypothetical protein